MRLALSGLSRCPPVLSRSLISFATVIPAAPGSLARFSIGLLGLGLAWRRRVAVPVLFVLAVLSTCRGILVAPPLLELPWPPEYIPPLRGPELLCVLLLLVLLLLVFLATAPPILPITSANDSRIASTIGLLGSVAIKSGCATEVPVTAVNVDRAAQLVWRAPMAWRRIHPY